MTTGNKEIWIKTGYEIFAIEGQGGLKIEPLCQKGWQNFYHHLIKTMDSELSTAT